jgi:hypothetical protein
MRALPTSRFNRDFRAAPAGVQKAFTKQLAYLLRNLRHLSLRAKKYAEARNIWQARVTGSWRFYFRIEGDTYVLDTIMSHSK